MKNILNTFAALSLLVCASSASATDVDLDLKVGESACLKREYSKQHLAEHPKQKLSSIFFKVSKKQVRIDGETYVYSSGSVVGVSRDIYYANTQATCEDIGAGALRCFVECDGGSFSVTPNRKHAILQVTPDYYFPLFESGKIQYESESLSLEGDEENGRYLVYPVSNQECDRALRAYRKNRVGGC